MHASTSLIFDFSRDIVMASHLKPLDKDDRLTEVKFIQPWNSPATKKVETADKEKNDYIPKVCVHCLYYVVCQIFTIYHITSLVVNVI